MLAAVELVFELDDDDVEALPIVLLLLPAEAECFGK